MATHSNGLQEHVAMGICDNSGLKYRHDMLTLPGHITRTEATAAVATMRPLYYLMSCACVATQGQFI